MHSSTESNPSREKWIEAGKTLAADRDAKVICPECGNAFLEVTDVIWPDRTHLDRHMRCPACASYNVLTKLRVYSG